MAVIGMLMKSLNCLKKKSTKESHIIDPLTLELVMLKVMRLLSIIFGLQ